MIVCRCIGTPAEEPYTEETFMNRNVDDTSHIQTLLHIVKQEVVKAQELKQEYRTHYWTIKNRDWLLYTGLVAAVTMILTIPLARIVTDFHVLRLLPVLFGFSLIAVIAVLFILSRHERRAEEAFKKAYPEQYMLLEEVQNILDGRRPAICKPWADVGGVLKIYD